jgi:hypothetical protein
MSSICLLIHGDSGVGKTTLASTAPAPRLVLDSEGGARFIRQHKIAWDPLTGAPPPEYDGTWETCVVTLRDYQTVNQVYAWLNSGQHPFNSVIVDSLSETQKKALDGLSGTDQPTTQIWGALLRTLEGFVRDLRDLVFHPVKPLQAVVIVCLSQKRDEKIRPLVKGQLSLTLPSFPDVVGYMFIDIGPSGEAVHKLQIWPYGQIDAKDRTGVLAQKYGMAIEEPNIEEMIRVIDADPFLGSGGVRDTSADGLEFTINTRDKDR